MKRLHHWSRLITLLLLVACSSGAAETSPELTNTPVIGQPFFFPQLKPTLEPRPFPEALHSGRLEVDGGCLRLQGGNDPISYLVIWPPHVEWQGNSVVDLKSGQRALFEVIAEFGGGVTAGNSPIFGELEAPLPEECPGPYWLVGMIMKGN